LRLDGRHTMYWEQSGNPRGAPVLFLHGGPGAGATAVHRRFFDPGYWRIVIFDPARGRAVERTGDLRFAFGVRTWFLRGRACAP
ncbi:MAG TPA: hypothetical protein VII14_05080, partial [Xanthobacteraceae bacterium]